MIFARLKLSTQLLMLVIGTVVLAIILLSTLAILLVRDAVHTESNQRILALVQMTGDLLSSPLAAGDQEASERILEAAVREEGLDEALIFAPDGSIVAEQAGESGADDVDTEQGRRLALDALGAREPQILSMTDHVDMTVPIIASDQVIGVLVGRTNIEGLSDEIATALPRMAASGLLVAIVAALIALLVARRIATPIGRLAVAASAIGRGELNDPPAIRGGGEIGTLANAFGQMIGSLRAARAEVDEQQRTLEARVAERTATLEQALDDLRDSTSAREQLSAAVRELASPVVPVLEGILVMPMIGAIDSQRALLLMDSLLHAIEHHRASVVILDVTGVPIVDTHVARTLLDAAHAVKLLGAQTVLVGLRPELAQTIVGLGLDLSGLITRADLQSGVSYAIQLRSQIDRRQLAGATRT
jgi:anti-anti-sigma factor